MKILVKKFMKNESTSGLILILVTIIALALRNSDFSGFYTTFLHTQLLLK